MTRRLLSRDAYTYDAMKQQKLKNKMKEPQHEGVLIFDEVKVQSKVRLPFACILTQCDRLRLDHFTSGSISVLFPFLSSLFKR